MVVWTPEGKGRLCPVRPAGGDRSQSTGRVRAEGGSGGGSAFMWGIPDTPGKNGPYLGPTDG